MCSFSRETDVQRVLITSRGKFPIQPNQKGRMLYPELLATTYPRALRKETIPEASCLPYIMSTAVNLTALILLKAMGFKVLFINA